MPDLARGAGSRRPDAERVRRRAPVDPHEPCPVAGAVPAAADAAGSALRALDRTTAGDDTVIGPGRFWPVAGRV